MAEVNIHRCVQAVVRFMVDSQPMAHVLNFQSVGSTVTAGDLVAVGGVVQTWVTNAYGDVLSEDVYFSVCDLKARDVDGGVEDSVTLDHFGQIDSPVFNLTECMVLALRTGVEGRSAHGKVYTPPLPVGSRFSNYFYTVLAGNALLGAFAALQSAADDADVPWVVASGKLGTVRPVTDLATTLHIANIGNRNKWLG